MTVDVDKTRDLDLKIQRICVWCGPVFLLTYLACFWGIAGWVPPTPPSWDAETLARFYDDHRTAIRIGQLGAMTAVFFLMPFWLILAGYIQRIERGRIPILAMLQLVAAAMNFVYFTIPSLVWLVASFRPELPISTLQTWHDFGWIGFLMPFAAYSMGLLSLGVAILTDTSERPIWPRWVGYFNLAVIATSCLAGLIVFFKSGPLAWNGLFAFYFVCVGYVTWMTVMTVTTLAHIRRERHNRDAAVLATDELLITTS